MKPQISTRHPMVLYWVSCWKMDRSTNTVWSLQLVYWLISSAYDWVLDLLNLGGYPLWLHLQRLHPQHQRPTRSCPEPSALLHAHTHTTVQPRTALTPAWNSQISGMDGMAYLDEAEELSLWDQPKNLDLNVSKTKEMVMDFRKMQQTPTERVSSYWYIWARISENLTWTTHTYTLVQRIM